MAALSAAKLGQTAAGNHWADDGDLKRLGAHNQVHTWLFTFTLAYGALGVIYGDIGTSPLYTLSSIFSKVDNMESEDVLMGISLVFWSITLVVLVKYVGIVLHANDQGEGSTIALYSNLCRVLGISSSGDVLPAHDHTNLITLAHRASLSRASSAVATAQHPPWGLPNSPCHDNLNDLVKQSKAPIPEAGEEPASPVAAAPVRRWWNWAAIPAEPLSKWLRQSRAAQITLIIITIVAPAMEMGDGVLTPAISVVSAVAGLEVGVPSVDATTVVGVSIAILVLLFSVQFKGTGRIAFLFSPIITLWLSANAAIGIYNIAQSGGSVFKGLSPYYIYAYFAKYGGEGWAMLGNVMLSVTGAEAMFSDLGHFNIGAVVVSWLGCAYPCLILTYLGQGAYLLRNLGDISTVYWSSIPKPVFWPMLVLATLASVVASQALISACFQICKQARALDFFPSVKIVHTSKDQSGQIYISTVNWALMVLSILVVLGFQGNPAHMGNAYGLTISMVMFITTVMVTLIMILKWRLSAVLVVTFALVFGLIDGAFVTANMSKIPKGGWVAIAITAGVALMNSIWWLGQRKRLSALAHLEDLDLASVFTVTHPAPRNKAADTADTPVTLQTTMSGRINTVLARAASEAHTIEAPRLALATNPDQPLATLPGVGLYYSTTTYSMPAVMRHFIRNVAAVHQVNIFVCVRHVPIPTIAETDRLLVRVLPSLPNTYQAVARYGYMEHVDHGQEFMDSLIEALVAAIEERAVSPTPHRLEASMRGLKSVSQRSRSGYDVSLASASLPAVLITRPSMNSPAEAVREPHLVPRVVVHAFDEITPLDQPSKSLRADSLQIPYEAPRLHPDLSRLSRAIESTSLARFSKAGAHMDGLGSAASGRTPAGLPHIRTAVDQPGLDEAAQRIDQLQAAAQLGVVYYVGRASVRMRPDSNIFHHLLYDNLYKPMLSLAYSETDAWQVPVSNLVELGMVLHI